MKSLNHLTFLCIIPKVKWCKKNLSLFTLYSVKGRRRTKLVINLVLSTKRARSISKPNFKTCYKSGMIDLPCLSFGCSLSGMLACLECKYSYNYAPLVASSRVVCLSYRRLNLVQLSILSIKLQKRDAVKAIFLSTN